MNRRWKQALVTGLMVMGLGMLVGKAEAGVGSSDTIVVNVTPNVTYAVQITSPMANGYDFGSQLLSATTLSTSGIGVYNSGNVAEYFAPSIANSSPGGWQPQSGAPSHDQYEMQAYFTSTNVQPLSSVVSQTLATTPPLNGASQYNQVTGGAGVGKTASHATDYLWLQLTMPSDLITSNGTAQTMLLMINAQGS